MALNRLEVTRLLTDESDERDVMARVEQDVVPAMERLGRLWEDGDGCPLSQGTRQSALVSSSDHDRGQGAGVDYKRVLLEGRERGRGAASNEGEIWT